MTGDPSHNGEAPLHPELDDESLRPAPAGAERGGGEPDDLAEGDRDGVAGSDRADVTPLWTTFRDVAGLTDRGVVKTANGDAFLTADLRRGLVLGPSSMSMAEGVRLHDVAQGTLLAVADADAGSGAGALASTGLEVLARQVATAMPWLVAADGPDDERTAQGLRDAFSRCRQRLRDEAASPGIDARAAVAALTAAYVVWPRMYVAHCGAGRCYHYTGTQLRRVTAEAGARPRTGAGGAGDARGRGDARGGGDAGDVDVRRVVLARGDRVLLCTDGLAQHVREREMARHLEVGATCAETCEALVALANERGGQDNATVIVGWL